MRWYRRLYHWLTDEPTFYRCEHCGRSGWKSDMRWRAPRTMRERERGYGRQLCYPCAHYGLWDDPPQPHLQRGKV